MTDTSLYLVIATEALAATAIVAAAGLAGWRGWLSLKRQELSMTLPPATQQNAGTRIELADMKERLRKLEAIAAGVDL